MRDYVKRMEQLDKQNAFKESIFYIMLEGAAFAGVVALALVVALVFGA